MIYDRLILIVSVPEGNDANRNQERKKENMIELTSDTTPIANTSDHSWHDRLFVLSFGAYGNNRVFVWADSLDSAFEEAVEYFDENGTHGIFTFLKAADYAHAANHLGLKWDPSNPDYRVAEYAEMDLTHIGWTTLECETKKTGKAFVASYEWTGSDAQDYETFATIKWRSIEADLDDDEG